MAAQADVGALVAAGGDGFQFSYVTITDAERRVPSREAGNVRFEDGLPMRRFVARKGQSHLTGWWWSSTTKRHVGFESRLERDHVMLLDFDPDVVGIASQPFRLDWADEHGRGLWHVPDYFARRADGSAVVIDCRPKDLRSARATTRFAATARACEQAGWVYQVVGAIDPVLARNLRWLGGYRHPRYDVPAVTAALRATFAAPGGLLAGAATVGDPVAVLPVLFHLMWTGRLVADLSAPLGPGTTVTAGEQP